MSTKTLEIELSADQLSKFTKIAERLGTTPTKVVMNFIDEWIVTREWLLDRRQTLITEFCRANP